MATGIGSSPHPNNPESDKLKRNGWLNVFHTVYVNASKSEIINMYIVVIEVNINKEAG